MWSIADYRKMMEMPDPSGRAGGEVPAGTGRAPEITFSHVSFSYPGAGEETLRDIDFTVRPGEKIAVVGHNGAGKTTLIKLLCGMYEPAKGEIRVDGYPASRWDLESWYGLFSVVFQDFKLFSFGLGENVAVSEQYGEEEVWSAINKAGLEDFGRGLPEGLNTVLYRDFDKSGLEISGGEAQKIALARAVCKGAPFVLLDEPTAALDPLAEYEIYSRFNELVQNRTTVYISHRMSSCRFCRDIAVFHQGRLIQRGSHETLMQETGGKYYELWTAQAKHYV